MTNINLLPWRERKRNKRQFWVKMVGGVLFVCGVVFLMNVYVAQRIHQQEKKNQPLKSNLIRLKHAQPTKVATGALSHLSLDALHFVGILSESSIVVALIKAPGGRIYAVKTGEYVGRNEGRVLRIDNDRIEIEEPKHIGKRLAKKRITLHL